MPPAKSIRLPLGCLTLLYLALPELIFFIGWLKPVWAILSIVPVVVCGWQLIRAWPLEPGSFRAGEITFLAAFSFALSAFAGIGGFAPQEFDWIYHNPVLADCITQSWPVVLADGPAHWPLVYYLAYYLPATVVGKMTGYAVAQAALLVWSSLGLLLTCCWFVRLSRLPVWFAPVALFSFSGLVFIASLLVQLLGLAGSKGWTGLYPNEFWARMWQFPSHFWMLEWAPGQALAGWLSAGMFLSSPKPLRPACFGLLFLCDLLWSPFVGLGLGLLAFFLVCREGWERPRKTFVPLLTLILPAGVLMAYFASKTAPEVTAHFPKIPIGWFWRFQDAPFHHYQAVILLLLFVIFQFGVLLWFVRASFPPGTGERNLANACALALLCLLPVSVGYYNDLAMRACTAPWFALALVAARVLRSGGLALRLHRWFWLMLLVSALTPLIEFSDQGRKLLAGSYDPDTVPKAEGAVVHIAGGGFDFLGAQYVGSGKAFFWKHLARSHDF